MVESHWYQDYIRNFGRLTEVDTAKLDWKRFLGNAKDQPYEQRHFQQWRWYWDFGGGALTDLHSHWGDVIHWYMREDQPLAATGPAKRYHPTGIAPTPSPPPGSTPAITPPTTARWWAI